MSGGQEPFLVLGIVPTGELLAGVGRGWGGGVLAGLRFFGGGFFGFLALLAAELAQVFDRLRHLWIVEAGDFEEARIFFVIILDVTFWTLRRGKIGTAVIGDEELRVLNLPISRLPV